LIRGPGDASDRVAEQRVAGTDDVSRLPPFRLGLNETGYTEGRNVAIEYRRAEDQIERLPALAAELASRQVSLILAAGRPDAALAAKSVTTSIPIVFNNAADPVQLGLVASLNRPGGNVTGVTIISAELETKRLGLLRELVASATSMAVLVNPTRPGVDAQLAQAQQAARILGLTLHILKASSEGDLDAVFVTLVQLKAGALGSSHTWGNSGIEPYSGSRNQLSRNRRGPPHGALQSWREPQWNTMWDWTYH
jgi:putative tryptophan/tyrosine transport system substrate-binding protein